MVVKCFQFQLDWYTYWKYRGYIGPSEHMFYLRYCVLRTGRERISDRISGTVVSLVLREESTDVYQQCTWRAPELWMVQEPWWFFFLKCRRSTQMENVTPSVLQSIKIPQMEISIQTLFYRVGCSTVLAHTWQFPGGHGVPRLQIIDYLIFPFGL